MACLSANLAQTDRRLSRHHNHGSRTRRVARTDALIPIYRNPPFPAIVTDFMVLPESSVTAKLSAIFKALDRRAQGGKHHYIWGQAMLETVVAQHKCLSLELVDRHLFGYRRRLIQVFEHVDAHGCTA